MIKETNYHSDWQVNRIKFILSKYPADFFKGKRILELGAYNGYIGAYFSALGAEVHCVEGRQENVDRIKIDYPNVSVDCINLDSPYWIFGKWDIIINFGLFYHLEKFHKEHLKNCIENCDLMFFETVVYDSSNAEIFFKEENGDDQSLSYIGGTPSTSYIENIFNESGLGYIKFSAPELNGHPHFYDWVDRDSKVFDLHSRRFWIIKK